MAPIIPCLDHVSCKRMPLWLSRLKPGAGTSGSISFSRSPLRTWCPDRPALPLILLLRRLISEFLLLGFLCRPKDGSELRRIFCASVILGLLPDGPDLRHGQRRPPT